MNKNSITININIKTFNKKEDYLNIIDAIEKKYNLETPFCLMIETINLSYKNVSLSNIHDFSKWLIEIKKKKKHFLKKTNINVYHEHVYNLLYFLFTYLSSPVAPVEVILYSNKEIDKIKTFYP